MVRLFSGMLLCLLCLPLQAVDLKDYQLVDLSHSYDEKTLYWPTSPTSFNRQQLSFGETEGGWFYAANSVSTPEHGGTHLDAPLHFSRQGDATDEIPLTKLITPAVLIDISAQAKADRNYRLNMADLQRFEQRHGPIAAGSAVLLRTGWSQYWPDAKAYLGDDTPGDASQLEFPSYGEEAARWLIEQRGVVSLGVDTASIDYGQSADFAVHRVAAEHNVVGLENLTGLEQLPATGLILLALPMKIGGGSGGPARVVAMVPK